MDMSKVDTIVHWSHPTNLEELQIFLGLAGFYRKYVCDYAKIVVPITDQLKGKHKTFTWGEEQQRSFEKLKVALASAPILAIVDPTKPFVVETDTSDRAIGAFLLQDGRPIAFESKKLDKAQQNYFVYERELYAIIHALKKWWHYLYGAQFEIVFDHESIKWFTQQTNLKGQKASNINLKQVQDPVRLYHQHFHFTVKKPTRYTTPNHAVATTFTQVLNSIARQTIDHAQYVLTTLKGTKKEGKVTYLGAPEVLTKIAYHAIGMGEYLPPIPEQNTWDSVHPTSPRATRSTWKRRVIIDELEEEEEEEHSAESRPELADSQERTMLRKEQDDVK
ncbi:hypothetical protein L7F22_065892 [Adiantum nelumboides]|nr:hypothetical protein [Adiantum nelumboides]